MNINDVSYVADTFLEKYASESASFIDNLKAGKVPAESLALAGSAGLLASAMPYMYESASKNPYIRRASNIGAGLSMAGMVGGLGLQAYNKYKAATQPQQ